MELLVVLFKLFVVVPVVVTPAVAVSDEINDTHYFQVICRAAEGKYDPQMLGTCEGGQWLNVYKNIYEAQPK